MELKPGYKQTEVGVIPEEWEIKKLGEITAYTNGRAHEKRIKDCGRYIVVNSKFISSEGETRKYSDDCFCPTSTGDVLMVMSDVPNGRAIAKCFYVDKGDLYTVNQRICALNPTGIDGKLLFYMLNRHPFYLAFDDGVKQTNLRKEDVLSCPLSIPKSDDEQRAIAGTLGDVDALIGALDGLIAKKRDLKQAAMQQLLTGQARLPGFSGEWEVKRLGNICKITTGKKDVNEGNPQGPYPFFTCSRKHTFSDSYSFDAEAILIAGNGDVGTLHYYKGKFEAYQRTYVLSSFATPVDHLYHYLGKTLISSLVVDKIGSSIPYIKLGNLKDLMIILPKDATETNAIAAVLSDMDAEIAALEARRDKTRALKQGMMQELLTGKTRLL